MTTLGNRRMPLHSRLFVSVVVAWLFTAATSIVTAKDKDKDKDKKDAVTTATKTVEVTKEMVTKTTEVKTPPGPAPAPGPFSILDLLRRLPAVLGKAQAPPRVAPAVARPPANPQQVKQWASRFRGILRAEYQVILSVCDPSKDQRREIARAGERGLTTAATGFFEWQMQPHGFVFKNGIQQIDDEERRPDPRQMIRAALTEALKAQLSTDQVARYQRETEQRDAEEKQMIIRNLVVELDQLLFLTASQREKLVAAFSKNKDDSWLPPLQMICNLGGANPQFPNIPDPLIVPELTSTQAKVWNSTPHFADNEFWFSSLSGFDAKPLEDAELDPPARAANPAPEVKP